MYVLRSVIGSHSYYSKCVQPSLHIPAHGERFVGEELNTVALNETS